MISLKFKGNKGFVDTNRYFDRLLKLRKFIDLNKYGIKGCIALRDATPKDTGDTANSWRYRIVNTKYGMRVEWYNSNKTDRGFPIAILLQYGHATKNGAWVEGKDYINPVLKPIFDDMANEIWSEVKNL